jgi:hypothetical protein
VLSFKHNVSQRKDYHIFKPIISDLYHGRFHVRNVAFMRNVMKKLLNNRS